MNTTRNAVIDHSSNGKGVVCEHCGYSVQVSKRHVVTHASNGRRACPAH
jgi:hypothetical protein